MSDSPERHGPSTGHVPTHRSSSEQPHRGAGGSPDARPSGWAVSALAGTTLGVVITTGNAQATPPGFLSRFANVVPGPSTVPTNGDVNPYGIVVVPQSTGDLVQGGVLVSNFNDAANAQGTGTTIVQEMPDGTVTQFAQITQASTSGPCPGGIGLTTALSVLPGGWVVVGSLPTTANGPANDGTPQGIGAGCLLVLNSAGQLVETWAGGAINGPWDMTATSIGDTAYLFVTNVLNGTVAADNGIPSDQPGNVVHGGTVVRIKVGLFHGQNPKMESQTVVASGFARTHRPRRPRDRAHRRGPRLERHAVRRRLGQQPDRGRARRAVAQQRVRACPAASPCPRRRCSTIPSGWSWPPTATS